MFKLEFYDGSDCDKCGNQANIHLRLVTKFAAERQWIALCWDCFKKIAAKVHLKAPAE